MTQNTNEGKKTPWMVRQNVTCEELGQLPANLTEGQVFEIMAFARKYELEAFNIGINFGKEKQREVSKQIINELTAKLQAVHRENERIADAMDKLTKKQPLNLN